MSERGKLYAGIAGCLLFALVGCAATVILSWAAGNAFWVAWRWHEMEAVIAHVEPAGEAVKQGTPFHLTLEVPGEEGRTARIGRTVEPFFVRRHGWSQPARVPVRGDKVAIYFDPAIPERVIVRDSLRDRWILLAFLPVFLGTTVMFSVVVVGMVSRLPGLHRRESNNV